MSGTQRLLTDVCATIAKSQLWILLLLAPFFLFPSPTRSVAMMGVPLLWACRWVARGHPVERTPLDWPILILMLMLPVTLWATAIPDRTLPFVCLFLLGIALFYAVVSWADSVVRLRWVVRGATALGAGLALLAPFGVDWFGDRKLSFIPAGIYSHIPQLLPDSIHPNILAGALVVLLPLPLSVWLLAPDDVGRRERWALAMSSGLMLLVIGLTKSRGAYLATAATVGLLGVWRSRRFVVAVLGVSGAAGYAIWRMGWRSFVEFLSQTGSIHGLTGRLEVWSRALYMIQDFPFTGVGMGLFGPVADVLYPFFLASSDQVPHAHNLLLQVGVDLGIPGLIAYEGLLLLGFVSAVASYRAFCRAGEKWLAALCTGNLASLVALMVHGLLDAPLWDSKPAFIPWAVFSLIAALHNLRMQKS